MSPRVFIIQRPAVIDRATNSWVEKYDVDSAAEFGALVDCLPIGKALSNPGVIMRRLEVALETYTGVDYLLAIGDPLAIAMAAIIASRHTDGLVNFLKWDRHNSCYWAHEIRTSSA